MHIDIEQINVDEKASYGRYTETIDGTRKEIFSLLSREYGRCISKVYIDRADGSTAAIGYCFQKRERYTDTGASFLCETWVSFCEVVPETHIPVPLSEIA